MGGGGGRVDRQASTDRQTDRQDRGGGKGRETGRDRPTDKQRQVEKRKKRMSKEPLILPFFTNEKNPEKQGVTFMKHQLKIDLATHQGQATRSVSHSSTIMNWKNTSPSVHTVSYMMIQGIATPRKKYIHTHTKHRNIQKSIPSIHVHGRTKIRHALLVPSSAAPDLALLLVLNHGLPNHT